MTDHTPPPAEPMLAERTRRVRSLVTVIERTRPLFCADHPFLVDDMRDFADLIDAAENLARVCGDLVKGGFVGHASDSLPDALARWEKVKK